MKLRGQNADETIRGSSPATRPRAPPAELMPAGASIIHARRATSALAALKNDPRKPVLSDAMAQKRTRTGRTRRRRLNPSPPSSAVRSTGGGNGGKLRAAVSAENLSQQPAQPALSDNSRDPTEKKAEQAGRVFVVCNGGSGVVLRGGNGNGSTTSGISSGQASGESVAGSADGAAGSSSCSSSTASPPDTDNEERSVGNVVRVAPDGSSSVIIQTHGLSRSRKAKKDLSSAARAVSAGERQANFLRLLRH